VLYASFESRPNALCLDLLNCLHNVSKERNLNNFELVLRISREKATDERWNAEYLQRQLENWKDLAKVYVCGPPAMNETFDRAFDQILRDQE